MPRRSAMLAKAWSFARITWPVAGAQTFAAGSCSESFLGDLEARKASIWLRSPMGKASQSGPRATDRTTD